MTQETLIQVAVNGLQLSVTYILIASGLAVIFSIMRIVNFAHGEIYMLGAFACYYLTQFAHINFFVSILITMIILAVIGLAVEKVFFQPVLGEHLNGLLVSIGLMMALQAGALVIFGGQLRAIDTPLRGTLMLFGASLSLERVIAIPVCIVVMIALYIFIYKTKHGRGMRAVAQDSEAATLNGVSLPQMATLSFIIGCALAGGAGAVMAPIFLINPYIGGDIILKAFVIICLGGLGSLTGAVAGGIILGLLDSFVATFLGGPAALLITFSVLIIILTVRPRGLLGHE